MKRKHPYGFEFDLESESFQSKKKKIQDIYTRIPKTKCLNCPGKKEVTGECCKVFFPPMLMGEFLSIIDFISTKDKEKMKDTFIKSIDGFMSTEIEKPCFFLDDKNQCSIYMFRPLSCRLFGLYPDEEWEDRLKNISEDLSVDKKDLPFCEQCRNITVNSKHKIIDTKKSDKMLRDLYSVDVEILGGSSTAKEVVFASATYMSFFAHYLCLHCGVDFVENLACLKEILTKAKKQADITGDSSEYSKKKLQILSVIQNIKEGIE